MRISVSFFWLLAIIIPAAQKSNAKVLSSKRYSDLLLVRAGEGESSEKTGEVMAFE